MAVKPEILKANYKEENDDWLSKYIQSENDFLERFKSVVLKVHPNASLVDDDYEKGTETESGWEALDNLYDTLLSMCEQQSENLEKCQETGKRETCNFLQVKQTRGRSHSSVGMDEVMRSQTVADIGSAESRRKSRRVSLGMRPKFTNWSKVKDAFKRDKSSSRLDSRDTPEVHEASYSGDEVSRPDSGLDFQSSSSHENTAPHVSSSEEEFDFYTELLPVDKNIPSKYQTECPKYVMDNDDYAYLGQCASFRKQSSATIRSAESPISRKPFRWRKAKCDSNTASLDSFCSQDSPHLSAPSSPYKPNKFLYDDEAVAALTSDTESPHKDTDLRIQQEMDKYDQKLCVEFGNEYMNRRRNASGSSLSEDFPERESMKYAISLAERNLSPAFRQRIQEWQRLKGSKSPLKKSKSDWQRWKPIIRSESNVPKFLKDQEQRYSSFEQFLLDDYSSKLKKEGLDILKGRIHNGSKKDLVWLENELQKVAREKQRLEKEKEKYAERETRLQNMKRAMKSGGKRKQEVLVPTSTGLFRFQGISSKFTRKLYEWEKARGITAESSTFALLDPYFRPVTKVQSSDAIGSLSRSRSVGSMEASFVSVNDVSREVGVTHQPSSLSLNDMEQLEEVRLQDAEDENLTEGNELPLAKEEDDTEDTREFLSRFPKHRNGNDADLCFVDDDENEKDNGMYNRTYMTSLQNQQRAGDSDFNAEVSDNQKKKPDDADAATAVSIVNQIQKLRARTSIDDEERIDTLTKLQNLADQLVYMVNEMNNPKSNNAEPLAKQIGSLAVELKREIRNLTEDAPERVNTYKSRAQMENEWTNSDAEDSPTLHCTFTLPIRCLKQDASSSTSSESSESRNKFVKHSSRPTYEDIYSSNWDENYFGEDETTVSAKPEKFKTKTKSLKVNSKADTLADSINDIVRCTLTLDSNSNLDVSETNIDGMSADSGVHAELHDEEASEIAAGYESPKLSKKKKCVTCGKPKRLLKGKKIPVTDYCLCTRKDSNLYKPESEDSSEPKSNENPGVLDTEEDSPKKMGKISRSKVYDFSVADTAESKSPNSRKQYQKVNKTAISVIVPTTRTIFAPLKQDENGNTSAVVSYNVDDVRDKEITRKSNLLEVPCVKDIRSKSVSPSIGRRDSLGSNSDKISQETVTHDEVLPCRLNNLKTDKLPPCSPTTSKKSKENSSNIKMMIAHYNKLVTEKPERRCSEGNCWSSATNLQKSPVLERKAHFEHLQNSDTNVKKSKSDVTVSRSYNDVSKSSSTGFMNLGPLRIVAPVIDLTGSENDLNRIDSKSLASDQSNVDKNIPTLFLHPKPNGSSGSNDDAHKSLASPCRLYVSKDQAKTISSSFENLLEETRIRSQKIQEAREKFFSCNTNNDNKAENTVLVKMDITQQDATPEIQLSQKIMLNKSVSTGAISDKLHSVTCETPPPDKSKAKFGFSSIASKFRKVKMRRHKDPEMGAISSLCRASLFMNINKDSEQMKSGYSSSKSCPSSPVVTHRSLCKRNSSSN